MIGLSNKQRRDADLLKESFLSLYTNLRLGKEKRPNSIMVTSAGAHEGKSTVAANLAITMAQRGERVLLIDADLRWPTLHEIFGGTRSPGLTDLLQGRLGLGETERFISPVASGLHFISSGSPYADPTHLLGTPVFRQLLDGFINQFETIILDSSPVLLAAEIPLLAMMTGGVILVLGAGKVTREQAQKAKHHLEKAGSLILGTILNKFDSKYDEAYSFYHVSK
jgi:tyrosine-protein kinase Etk/Wzc